jgi:hypothetical protein
MPTHEAVISTKGERERRGSRGMELPVIIVGLALITLVAIIVAPSRRVRAERRLPSDVETRVLLGEKPDEIEAAIAPRGEREESAAEPFPPAAS